MLRSSCMLHPLTHSCTVARARRSEASIRCASFRRASAVRIPDGFSDVAPWVGSAGAAQRVASFVRRILRQVFRENETSIVLSEIKEKLPEFFVHACVLHRVLGVPFSTEESALGVAFRTFGTGRARHDQACCAPPRCTFHGRIIVSILSSLYVCTLPLNALWSGTIAQPWEHAEAFPPAAPCACALSVGDAVGDVRRCCAGFWRIWSGMRSRKC